MKYILSCCSTSDLTRDLYNKLDINVICFHYIIDGKEYSDDFGESISFEEFYQKMEKGSITKTSQVNVEEFIEYFTPFLEKGLDILHVSLSSGISGVYNSACIARDVLKEKYPKRNILIVDSLGASSGYGLLMSKLAQLRNEGRTIDEIYNYANENRLNVHHWFFSTDLKYYVRGGRISKTSGFFGNLFSICPLLNMDDLGRLIPREKVRTKKNVIIRIVDKMVENAEDGLDYQGKCYICHSNCYEDALKVKELIEQKFKSIDGEVQIFNIGTTIGSHTGPGTIALFFFGNKRTD